MNSNSKPAQVEGMQAKLSTLWVFLMFNMVFADIFGFMYPGFLQQLMSGNSDGTQITPVFLLIAAMVTEISIAMVFLSRLLKPGINRWVNIAGAVITSLWVIVGGAWSMLHYILFASIEVVCALAIIWLAWRWHVAVDQER